MAFRLPDAHAPAWVLAESAASAGFSLGSLLLIGRVVGPEEAGAGALAIAVFLLLDLGGATLFPDAIIQRATLRPAHLRSALTAAVLGAAALAAMLALAAPLLARVTDQPALATLLPALALLLPFSAFSGTASGLATRERRFRLLSLRVLLGQPLALAAGLAAAAEGFGAWAMVVNQAVATLVVFAIMFTAGGMPLRPLLEGRALGQLWPVAGPQVLAILLASGRYRIFLLALGTIFAEAALALANVAFRMVDAALLVVLGAVRRIALPRLCALQGDREALARCYAEVAQLPALLGLPVALGVALVADDLVAALLGPDWEGAAEAARLVAGAACLTCLHGDPGSLFIALGRAQWNTAAAVANLALPLAALLAFRPESLAGAALAWGTQALVVTPVLAFLVLRQLGRGPLFLVAAALPGLVAALAMVPAVLLVQAALADAAPLPRLLLSVAAGAVCFGAVAWRMLGGRMPRALSHAPAAKAGMPAPDRPLRDGPRRAAPYRTVWAAVKAKLS